jgi:rod shape-determining protein MreC
VRGLTRKIIIACAVALLLLFNLVPAAGQFLVGMLQPAAGATDTVRSTAGSWRRFLPGKKSRNERLLELEEENARLQLSLRRCRAAEEENRELRRLLGLEPPRGWVRTAAPVIAHDPVAWHRHFRIGKGKADGIAGGEAVLHGVNVIGRVTEVTAHSALVTTIADPGCRLSVQLGDIGSIGVLAGRLRQESRTHPVCLIDYLSRDEPYRPGMPVTTSGLSQTIPGGLYVGRTIAWAPGTAANIVNASYAQLKLRPAATLRAFHHVTVLTKAAE